MSQSAYSRICQLVDKTIADSKQTLLDMKEKSQTVPTKSPMAKKKDVETSSTISEKGTFITKVYRTNDNKKLFLAHYFQSKEPISDEDMKILTKNYAVRSSSSSSLTG